MKVFALILFLVGLGVLAYFLLEMPTTPEVKPSGSGEVSPSGADVPRGVASPQDRSPRMIVANFSYPRYDEDEIQWEVQGVNAEVKGEDEVKLEEPRITFYPKRDADSRGPESVLFLSRRGDVKKVSNVALLYDGVAVTTSDGSSFQSSELSSNFEEKRIHSDSEVIISRGGMRINGRVFDGHIEFEEFQIREQITLSLESAEKLVLEPNRQESPASSRRKPGLSFFNLAVTCDGPLTMENQKTSPGMPARWRVVFRQHVFISRETLHGESRLFADEVEAILVETAAGSPQEEPSRISIDRLLAVGNARLEDVQFNASARRILFQVVEDQEVVTLSGLEQTISFKSARGFRLFETGPRTRSLRTAAGPERTPDAAGEPTPTEPTVVTCTGDAVVKRSFVSPGKARAEEVIAVFDRSVRARSEHADLLSDSLVVELKPVYDKKATSDNANSECDAQGSISDSTGKGQSVGASDSSVRFEISMIRANGNVLLVEEKLTTKADELVWTPATGTADLVSHRLSEIIDQKNRALARQIRLYRNENLIVCEHEVDATFLVKKGKGIETLFRTAGESDIPPDPAVHGTAKSPDREQNSAQSPPVEQEWRLKCQTLRVKLRPEDNSFESLDAKDNVSIATERMTATGAAFTYFHSTGHGSLVGKPLATVTNADNVVTADKMEFFANEKKIVLRGRKHILLSYEQRDEDGFPTGKIERIEARSLGDIVIFQDEGMFCFLREAIVIRPGSWMHSDRMTIYFDPKEQNRLRHIFAVGNVLVDDTEGLASGDMLEWDFDAGVLVVKAQPYACIAQKGKPLYGEIVTIDQDWTRIKSRNPKWGRGRIIIPETMKEQKTGGKRH
jgi:LPS export ABC transporter protein LptC